MTKSLQGIPDAMLTPAQKELAKAQRTSNQRVLQGALARLIDGVRSVNIDRREWYTHIAQPLQDAYQALGGPTGLGMTAEEIARLRDESPVETFGDDTRDAARYRWLRQARGVYDDTGRFPQGDNLDECCDAFMAKQRSQLEPARRIPPREFDIESHTGLYTEPSRELPPAFQSLLDLQPNWDSYGSKRINLACVQKAYEIWKQLAGTWLPVPHSDGTVGLEQHQGGFDIEIDVDLALPAEKAPEPQMSMLPNDHHPGPRCSCRECLSRYPSQKVSAKLCDHRRGIDDSGHCVMCDELIMPPLNGDE